MDMRMKEAQEGDSALILQKLMEGFLQERNDIAQENTILKMELEVYKEKFAESLAVSKNLSEELETLKRDHAQENAILKMELEVYKEKFAESLAVSKRLSEELEPLKKDIVPENAILKMELDVYKAKFKESLAMTKMVSQELDSRNHDFLYYKNRLEDATKELESTKKMLMSKETEIKILQSQVALSSETNTKAEEIVREEQLKTEIKPETPSTNKERDEEGYEKWKPKKGYTLKGYNLKMDKENSREAEIKKLTWVSIAVAQKLHKSEKVNESLKTELKREKEKVAILGRELDDLKEAREKEREESRVRKEDIGMDLEILIDLINILREEQEGQKGRKKETNEIQEMKAEIYKQNAHIRKLKKGNKRLQGLLDKVDIQLPDEGRSYRNQNMDQ